MLTPEQEEEPQYREHTVTPRGIVLYIRREQSFALMQRLFPSVDAFRVLEDVQGISKIYSFWAILAGLACFVGKRTPIQIAIGVLAIPLIMYGLRQMGLILGLRGLAIYSRFTGFGVILLAMGVLGFFRVGILGLVAFFGAFLMVYFLTTWFESIIGKRMGMKMGESEASAKAGSMCFAPVRDFFWVYKHYAWKNFKMGKVTVRDFDSLLNTEVTEHELMPEHWAPVWNDFARKWPEIVASRYSPHKN